MTRIDDARAAELEAALADRREKEESAATAFVYLRIMRGLSDALADRADYEARIEEERKAIAAEARRYASHYPQSSDGRNTFILLAEWIDRRAQLPTPSPTDAPASDTRDAPDDQVVIRSGGLYWRANAAGYTVSIFEAGRYSRAEAERLTAGIGPEKGISIIAAPPPRPASGTRALAVEICEEVLAVQASMRGAPYGARAVANVERILRKTLPADAPSSGIIIGRLREMGERLTGDDAFLARHAANLLISADAIIKVQANAAEPDRWRPRSAALEDCKPVLLRGKGIYHGMPFAGRFEPDEFAHERPWLNLITGSRLLDHCIEEWMPIEGTTSPDTDRKLARAVALEESLQAIIDWADLALSNRAEFDKHGAKNLAGPVFDAARDVLADLTTAPAEAETAPDIKPMEGKP